MDYTENNNDQKDKWMLGPCQRTKMTVDYEGGVDAKLSWCSLNGPQIPGKRQEELEIETIQTTVFLRLGRIVRRVQEN